MFKFNFDIEEDEGLDPSTEEFFQPEGTVASSTSSTQKTTSVEDDTKEISVEELVKLNNLLGLLLNTNDASHPRYHRFPMRFRSRHSPSSVLRAAT